MAASSDALPIVVVPVGVDEQALDACLGALDAATPPGTRVWLADDAQGGPRVRDVIAAWRAGTRLEAEYTRRPHARGEAAHLADVLMACGDADVAVLACDARPAPGWLTRMARVLHDDASATTVTPWCNAGETAAWPRLGEVGPPSAEPELLAAALVDAALAPVALPSAVDHAVLIRGRARREAGGLDASSYASWYAALIDLSLRMQAFGGRDLLCTQAYVARDAEGRPVEGDLDRVAARWPHWTSRLAGFLMDDPARAERDAVTDALHRRVRGEASQADLFARVAS